MYHMNHQVMSDLLDDKNYRRLLAKCDQLEKEIQQISGALIVDWDGLSLKKREKLRARDEIAKIERMRH